MFHFMIAIVSVLSLVAVLALLGAMLGDSRHKIADALGLDAQFFMRCSDALATLKLIRAENFGLRGRHLRASGLDLCIAPPG